MRNQCRASHPFPSFGMKISNPTDKGRGVFTIKDISKLSFQLLYCGPQEREGCKHRRQIPRGCVPWL